MQIYRIPVLVVVAIACACGTALAGGPPVPALDHSLPASALIDRGFPAPDRLWTGQDYDAALKALEALAKTDPLTLPRAGSPQSGPAFARLVAEDNLTLLHAKGLSEQQALGLGVGLISGVSSMVGLYSRHSTPQSTFDSELTGLMSFMLALAKDFIGVGKAFVDTIPADDPQREARLAGYEQMRGGLGSIVSGCITTLTEQEVYRPEARLGLANALERHLSALYPYLLSGVQQELPGRLDSIVAAEPNDALKQAVQRIRATLPAR